MCSLRSLRLLQMFFNPFQDPLRVSQLTFPDSNDAPAGAAQHSIYNPVAGFVPCQFLFPESGIIRRFGRVPGAAVPEATVHEQCEPHLPEYKIRVILRVARATSAVCRPSDLDFGFWTLNLRTTCLRQPLISICAQQSRHHQFRVLVSASTNPRHHFRTLGFGENVRHSKAHHNQPRAPDAVSSHPACS